MHRAVSGCVSELACRIASENGRHVLKVEFLKVDNLKTFYDRELVEKCFDEEFNVMLLVDRYALMLCIVHVCVNRGNLIVILLENQIPIDIGVLVPAKNQEFVVCRNHANC